MAASLYDLLVTLLCYTLAEAVTPTRAELNTLELSNGLYFLKIEESGIVKGKAKFNIMR